MHRLVGQRELHTARRDEREPARRHTRDPNRAHVGMIVGYGRLWQDRHAGARRDEIGDEPDALYFDRDSQLDVLGARRVVDLVAQRVALGRKDDRMVGEDREWHGLIGAEHERRGHETDEVFVAQVLDDQARIRDRLGHDGARELAFGDLDRQPL